MVKQVKMNNTPAVKSENASIIVDASSEKSDNVVSSVDVDLTSVSVLSVAPLRAAFDTNVRPLLDVIDKVREILGDHEGIELPSIAVIGNQSAGKTSVLERLSGVTLPRGDGMVTRCALVLRMVCVEPTKSGYALIKGGKTGYAKGKKIDLLEIADCVKELTDELAPAADDISDDVISLSVFSPNVPDLTLIDLVSPFFACLQLRNREFVRTD